MKLQLEPKVNQINPSKLLLSKWTAASPNNKEKHFLITKIFENQENKLITCQLEAVLTGKVYEIDWRLLKNRTYWHAGWL